MTHSYLYSQRDSVLPQRQIAGLSIKMLHCIRQSRFHTATAFIITVYRRFETNSSCSVTWNPRKLTCSRGCRSAAEGRAAGSRGSGVGWGWAG